MTKKSRWDLRSTLIISGGSTTHDYFPYQFFLFQNLSDVRGKVVSRDFVLEIMGIFNKN